MKKGKWIKLDYQSLIDKGIKFGEYPITLIEGKKGYRIHIAACGTKYRYIKDDKKEENKEES